MNSMNTVKNISRSLISFFAMLCIVAASALSPSQAQVATAAQPTPATVPNATEAVFPPVATTESLVLVSGHTLWKHFVAQKLPRRDWPKYWKDACALSSIACTDAAWRKLSVGKALTVPRDPRVILADRESRQVIARQQEIEKAAEKATIAESARLAKSLLDKKETAFRTGLFEFLAIALMLVVSLIFWVFIVSGSVRKSRNNDDAFVPEHVEKINADQFFGMHHSSPISSSSPAFEGIEKSPVRHVDKYLPSETPHATYPPKYVTEVGSAADDEFPRATSLNTVNSSFGTPVEPATESGKAPLPLESDTAIAPNTPACETGVEPNATTNAHTASADKVELVICEVYKEPNRAFAYDEDSSMRYLLNENTEGFTKEIREGEVVSALVTRNNYVLKIFPAATQLRH